MKRLAVSILCLVLCLTACAEKSGDAYETDWTVRQMAQAVWNAGSALDGTEILPGGELYDTYLTSTYGLSAQDAADGAMIAAGGMSAQETAVFRLAETAGAGEITQILQSYLERRRGAFTGYLPEEAALLDGAQVVVRGAYVFLIACEDMDAAQAATERCFTDDPPENTPEQPAALERAADPDGTDLPPEEADVPVSASADPEPASEPEPPVEPEPASEPEPPAEPGPAPQPEPAEDPGPWSYDKQRLIDAWDAGDWSGLAPEDQAILDICREVIETAVPSGGSEYDKELAVHDWMIEHAGYDNNRLSQLPDFEENPNNDNPYGFLADGKGICLGYTTTFQLFMDLLGIECITVEGAAFGGTEEHAWNQVRLDGEWYCVDTTWDDPTTGSPVSEPTAHRYFNVTSEYMRDTDHQWDEDSVPEALGTEYAWQRP